MQASAAHNPPSHKAAIAPCVVDTWKQAATSAAPVAWPNRRTVPIMPLAPPARDAGAEVMMARRLGDWKKPKPAPQIAMRHEMSHTDGVVGINASSTMPSANSARPTPPKMPAGYLSDRRPAIGAMMATTTGHGVIRKPVCTWL